MERRWAQSIMFGANAAGLTGRPLCALLPLDPCALYGSSV